MNLENSFMREVIDIGPDGVQAEILSVDDTTSVFDDGEISLRPVPGYEEEKYVAWGDDNLLPLRVRDLIGSDEVTSQNKLFNVLTCYGAGIQLKSVSGESKQLLEAKKWARRQYLPQYFLNQITDMKYYYFSVCVIILNKGGDQINRIVHKDAAYCRLQEADSHGRIRHIYYADWSSTRKKAERKVERIRLLDMRDPIGHLMRVMGKEPGKDGLKRKENTHEGKYAMVMRMPTVGCKYYPVPYYASIFRGGSYDEKRLISTGKRAKLRNHMSVKYQVEVARDYWDRIIAEEKITDPVKQQERIKKEKEAIRDFVAGIHNSGKAWITGYYVDPLGKEIRDIRVVNIEGSKEGGDWADDINVSANTLCYADNIHPNLVGAVPGKSQNNNSGSDKRELYTMKQLLETAFHDIMLLPLQLAMEVNGWDDVEPTVPIIQLTTLDEHRDSKKVSLNKNDNPDE